MLSIYRVDGSKSQTETPRSGGLMNTPATPQNLTVSRLVELIREVVESNFFAVAVEGEVSNFAALRPATGILPSRTASLSCVP